MREAKLNQLDDILTDLTYPITPAEASEACSDVTLVLAEGDVNLGDVVSRSHSEHFVSDDDLTSELMSLLPRRAVGEPFQSDGDA